MSSSVVPDPDHGTSIEVSVSSFIVPNLVTEQESHVIQEIQVSVPITIIVIGFVEPKPKPNIILDTRLYLLSKGEPLVPKVYIFVEEVVRTPREFISLVSFWDLAFSYFWKVL